MTTRDENNYYLKVKPELMGEFKKVKTYLTKVLRSYFDQPKAERLLKETQLEFETLLPQLPYIGGEANVFTASLVRAAWCLPLFRTLGKEGLPFREIGKIGYEQKEHDVESKSREKKRSVRKFYFSPGMRAFETERAEETQSGKYPGDFVSRYVEGDGETFDFGIDFLECGICKFFEPRNALKYVPFFCLGDYATYRAFGIGFKRTQTIVEGASFCDFRFRKDGETPRGWPPEQLKEKFWFSGYSRGHNF